MMRRLLLSIGALIAFYGAAAWAFRLPPFKSAPVFYENVAPEGQNYTCGAGDRQTMFIRFEQEGQIAVVRAGNHTLRLAYKTSDWMFEIYESGPWQLTLDPEANLTGPGEVNFANCY